jgi:hypothetical protein
MMPFHKRNLLFLAALTIGGAAPLAAQKGPRAAAATAATPIMGTWVGTATVQLGDSTIVVPVTYNFTQTPAGIAGTAMVPGQGTGPISNVVRDGSRIQFRVTAPENRLLEHDGKVGADGTIEGMVNFNAKPVAKFRISAKK